MPRFNGVDSPDMLNADPERFAAEIVKGAFPVFSSVTFSLAVPPTETSPNASVAGDKERVGAMPVPVSVTETVLSVALLATDNVALTLPACWGAN
jgi:hypothetical protein